MNSPLPHARVHTLRDSRVGTGLGFSAMFFLAAGCSNFLPQVMSDIAIDRFDTIAVPKSDRREKVGI